MNHACGNPQMPQCGILLDCSGLPHNDLVVSPGTVPIGPRGAAGGGTKHYDYRRMHRGAAIHGVRSAPRSDAVASGLRHTLERLARNFRNLETNLINVRPTERG